MPSFVEIGRPVPEKILEDSATRLYDFKSYRAGTSYSVSRNSSKANAYVN